MPNRFSIFKERARIYKKLQNETLQHLLHAGGIFFILFFSKVLFGKEDNDGITGTFFDVGKYFLVACIPVYFCFFFFYKKELHLKFIKLFYSEKLVAGWEYAVFMVATTLACAFFSFSIIENFEKQDLDEPFATFFFVFFMVLLMSGVSEFRKQLAEQRNRERRNRTEIKRRLQSISYQMRPHFVLNTLRNLKILARDKSDSLPDLLDRLTNLLDYLSYKTSKNQVPLSEEIDFLKSYFELEQLRLASMDELSFNIDINQPEIYQVPPMILLPFFENCFKHFFRSKTGKSVITIDLSIKNERLYFQSKNTFSQKYYREENTSGGKGLTLGKERLKELYNENFYLQLNSENEEFEVNLDIPITEISEGNV